MIIYVMLIYNKEKLIVSNSITWCSTKLPSNCNLIASYREWGKLYIALYQQGASLHRWCIVSLAAKPDVYRIGSVVEIHTSDVHTCSYKSLQSCTVKPKCLTLWGCFSTWKSFIAGLLCFWKIWFILCAVGVDLPLKCVLPKHIWRMPSFWFFFIEADLWESWNAIHKGEGPFFRLFLQLLLLLI